MTHLDLDGLADVLAGLGDRTHLDGCPACQSRLAELEMSMPAVTASLALLAQPEVPDEVAERLDGLLATAGPSPTADVLPLRPRSHVRWLPALAGVAAAALLVVGGVLVSQRGGGHPTRTSAAPHLAVNSTGTDYTRAGGQLAQQLPALLAGTAEPLALDRSSFGAATPAPTALKDTTTQLQLSPQVADPLARLRTTAGLASCLAALTDPSEPGLPLALDYAEFEGAPALVVVLPATTADKVDVFVVGAACAQADAKVLFFTRLTKP